MPVPVDSKYIIPAYLPLKQSLTFPSVGATGIVLGWGHNNQMLNVTTTNRYLQRLELTLLNINASPCKENYTFNQTDVNYSVNDF